MKYTGKNIIEEMGDTYLGQVLNHYYEVRKKLFKHEDLEEFFDALNLIFRTLSYRNFITVYDYRILDTKLEYLIRKGKAGDIDFFDDERISTTPFFADIREQGSKTDFVRYGMVFTSVGFAQEMDAHKCIRLINFKDYYLQFRNDDSVKGVIINLNRDSFIINKELCEYIYNDCPREFWDKYVKLIGKAFDKIIFDKDEGLWKHHPENRSNVIDIIIEALPSRIDGLIESLSKYNI